MLYFDWRVCNESTHRFTWVFLSRWEFSVFYFSFSRLLFTDVYLLFYNSFCAEDFQNNYSFLERTFMSPMLVDKKLWRERRQLQIKFRQRDRRQQQQRVFYGCAQFMPKVSGWARECVENCLRLSSSD